jgi:hypothetical protein
MITNRLFAGLAFLVALPALSALASAQTTLPTGDAVLDRVPEALRTAARQKLDAVEHEVRRREQTHPVAAVSLARDLKRVRDHLAGDRPGVPPAGKPLPPQLHVVGLYEPKHWRTSEVIHVTAGDRPVILALCSYEPVRWEIRIDPGATVRRVIVGGYHEQTVSFTDAAGAPPVDVHTREGGQGDFFYAYSKNDARYQRMRQTLAGLTDAPLRSFQGSYTGGGGTPYVVGGDTPAAFEQVLEEEVEPLYREATALERARPLAGGGNPTTFPAIWIDPPPAPPANAPQRPPPMLAPAQLATFTVDGPIKGTFKPLRIRLSHVAFDAADGVYYGVDNHSVFRVDPRPGGGVTPLAIKGDVPRMSWLCGAAFDTKRRRLIVASFGGVGYLCAYSPAKNEWTYLAELNNVDLAGLVYCAADDCLYGLDVNRERAARTTIHRLTAAEGQFKELLRLDEAVASPPNPMRSNQLVMPDDDHLAIFPAPPYTTADDGYVVGPARCVIVDRKTGKVLATRTIKPHVPPASDFRAEEVDQLWPALGADDAARAEAAVDRLVAGGERAAAALVARLSDARSADPQRVRQLIEQLDDEQPAARTRASADLIAIGPAAGEQLRQALAVRPSPESTIRLQEILRQIAPSADGAAPSPQGRRERRIVRVLADLATPAAVEHLIALSAGPQDSALTRAAREALRQL